MTNTRLTPDILENNRLQSGQRAILQGNSSVRDFLACGVDEWGSLAYITWHDFVTHVHFPTYYVGFEILRIMQNSFICEEEVELYSRTDIENTVCNGKLVYDDAENV